ncbi:MAG: hypothetical protein WC393_01610 [Candidatus Nanoarchaeia archaeon]|jgi:hypothetical protein
MWTRLNLENKRIGKPMITLLKSKYIRFNTQLVRENNLIENNFVEIFIDKTGEKIKIGFAFIKENKKGVLKLSKYKDSMFIPASLLLRDLGKEVKDFEITTFYPVIENYENNKIFVIEVSK